MGKVIKLNKTLTIESLLDNMNQFHLDFKVIDKTFSSESTKLLLINSKNISKFIKVLSQYCTFYNAHFNFTSLDYPHDKIVQLGIHNDINNLKFEVINIIACDNVRDIVID